MRMLAMMAAVLVLSAGAQGEVWITVYRCDERTPLVPADPNHPSVYQGVMVGTKLVLVVSSDDSSFWWGSLQYSQDDKEEMFLTGRGYDAVRRSFAGSCLPAAGKLASVEFVDYEGVWSFDLTADHPSPGDWFILDYYARGVGIYNIAVYDLSIDWTTPMEVLSFVQVPSWDFNEDGIVNFVDFAMRASDAFLLDPAGEPEPGPRAYSGDAISFRDLSEFSEHWLERTTCEVPAKPDE